MKPTSIPHRISRRRILALAGVTGEGLLQAGVMGSVLGTSALLAWLDLIEEVGASSNA